MLQHRTILSVIVGAAALSFGLIGCEWDDNATHDEYEIDDHADDDSNMREAPSDDTNYGYVPPRGTDED